MSHLIAAVLFLTLTGAAAMAADPDPSPSATASTEQLVLGGGCFWCVESSFEEIPGVLDVESGYAAGAVDQPTYHQVCGGDTGHAEVVRVTFDPARVTVRRLVDLFWVVHDPTTPNRQGHDVGTQYRSIILTASPAQAEAATASRDQAQVRFRDPIVTEIRPLAGSGPGRFHPAETYHQDYFRKNPDQAYCQAVIPPKLKKLRQALAEGSATNASNGVK